jgi:hypothetical protein
MSMRRMSYGSRKWQAFRGYAFGPRCADGKALTRAPYFFRIRVDATLPSPAVPPRATIHAMTHSTGFVFQ